MPVRQGTAIWPGVQGVISCTYTCSHGATPGTAVLVCHPQTTPVGQFGALVITDGIGRVTLPGCRLDNLYGPRGEGEKTWTLEIVDRRWRWRELGFVNGVFNQRDPRGRILFWTLATIPQLMAMCLDAMGEVNYTLNLPTVITNTESVYPAIEWDAANPAHELTRLCERIGCRVVYRVDTNSVLVTPVGVGAPLPNGPLQREGPSLRSPEAPDSIVLVGAPVRFQARFALMAVGKEWDGSYRPIEFLSYAPGTLNLTAGGNQPSRWANSSPPGFQNVTATDRLSLNQAKALARESVFKTYQLINLDPNARFFNRIAPLSIPGFGKIARIQQIIPQETQVLQIVPEAADPNIIGPDGKPLDKAFYDGYQHDMPAKVYGKYFFPVSSVRYNTSTDNNTNVNEEVLVPFHIDPELLLVHFDQYVFEAISSDPQFGPVQSGAGTIKPAELVLETGCLVRALEDNQIVRFTATKVLTASPALTPPAIVRHEDCQLNIIGIYDEFTSGLTNIITDAALGNVMANYYLACEAAKYDLTAGLERVYRGIQLVACDGAIQQVSWSVGGGQPAQTQASRQFEHSTYIPTFLERLKIQYLAAAAKRGGPEQPDRLAGPALFAPSQFSGANP